MTACNRDGPRELGEAPSRRPAPTMLPPPTAADGDVSSEASGSCSSSSSCYAGMGFMFEGSKPSRALSLTFTARGAAAAPTGASTRHGAHRYDRSKEGNEGGHEREGGEGEDEVTVHVELSAVDGDPGALQSGHYLWPAGPAMAQSLVDSVLMEGPGIRRGGIDGANDEAASTAGSNSSDNEEIRCGRRPDCNPTGRRRRLDLSIISDGDDNRPLAVAELGSGCGLAGIVAMQALTLLGRQRRRRRLQSLATYEADDQANDEANDDHDDVTSSAPLVRCVAFTDHDPTVLERTRGNHAATLNEIRRLEQEGCEEGDGGEGNDETVTTLYDDLRSIPVLFEPLSWGDESGAAELRRKAAAAAAAAEECHHGRGGRNDDSFRPTAFDLILGSDLIYCREVVRPLLRTAKLLMASSPSSTGGQEGASLHSSSAHFQRSRFFFMSQSFPYDAETEAEIDASCLDLGLTRTVLSDNLDTGEEGGVKFQTFALV